MPIIPALKRIKQEDQDFKVSLAKKPQTNHNNKETPEGP
jgi:hypothetical protein